MLKLDFPKDCFEVIVVDNNSKDKSREIIIGYANKYQNVRHLFLKNNKGFAGGNNEGIKIAKGEYIILLNNDCVVDHNWLSSLVKTAQKDKKIFAVNSKILLYPKYLSLNLKIDPHITLTGAEISKSSLCVFNNNKKIKILPTENNRQYNLEIPVDYQECEQFEIILKFQVNEKSIDGARILKLIDLKYISLKILNKRIKGNELVVKIIINISGNENQRKLIDKIQNAGIVVFQDGSGRDIGAKIIEQRQYYEYDLGQYSQEQEVYAACGAAVLYNKKVLENIGLLDEKFFMYYEDVEISERARLHGYKIVYCPKAIVRHLHAFSSIEWSKFFIYQAEKGKLLHVFYHFPVSVFLKEYFKLIFRIGEVWLRILKGISDQQRLTKFIRSIISSIFGIKSNGENEKTDFGKVIQYIKVLVYFPIHLPILLVERYLKHKGIRAEGVENNYRTILKGRWYFDR